MTAAERVAALLGVQVRSVRAVGGGFSTPAHRVELADGRLAFAKTHADPPPGFFAAEAAGLAFLRDAGGPVPEVWAHDEDAIVMEWVEQAPVTPAAAEELGRRIAALHRAGAPSYGAGWPGFIGPLALDNTPADDWPTFYAERRVRPYLEAAAEAGAIRDAERRAIEDVLERLPTLAGPPEPPAPIHGDLWGGNVLWVPGGAVIVDPAAHGGHRETDLAMLALFGVSHLDRLLAAYDQVFPLAEGWRERVPLHQLHPLLVHAAIFGGGYGARAARAVRDLR